MRIWPLLVAIFIGAGVGAGLGIWLGLWGFALTPFICIPLGYFIGSIGRKQ